MNFIFELSSTPNTSSAELAFIGDQLGVEGAVKTCNISVHYFISDCTLKHTIDYLNV
ncbi:hypothetical protein [Rhodohalobacter sp. SW132]|uniref:hypothetical protein n=1 Tax=Rhodohalobacter sp. SW132 TaxID=2293433 RepID=UPI0013147110|nr:hypothetical protein [Rhodohalobacter sp. SW132]